MIPEQFFKYGVALMAVLYAASVSGSKVLHNITKSDQDQNEYRAIELSNGLIALLVHDPLCEN